MIPGEYRLRREPIVINKHRKTEKMIVTNAGDRPIQVGSHFHFYEVNKSLQFDRKQAYGMRLHIPAGLAIRFEPGEEKPVTLVRIGGERSIYGLNGWVNGPLDETEPQAHLQIHKNSRSNGLGNNQTNSLLNGLKQGTEESEA
ncbi:urease subunit beta [Marinicrinis sediminis]|uniref:Urease subunit beta n=1 Tax=Marinicrinis sediminis TaxID=1652465 RepID=A0ABW5R846_9BACL